MKWEQVITGVLILAALGCSRGKQEGNVGLQRFLEDKVTGIPAAVRLDEGLIIHTSQLFPKKATDENQDSSAEEQLNDLLIELDSILKEHGSGKKNIAKLNLYVSDPDDCDAMRKAVADYFEKGSKPTVTVISTLLPRAQAKVALDAVAIVADSEEIEGVQLWSDITPGKGRTFGGEALAAVAGSDTDLVYISGRASKAEDLATGTKGTVEQLMSVLQMLGGGPEHVVQIKAFLNPINEAAFAAEAIQSFFKNGDRPPVVMVEWSSTSYPTEIELIAAIPNRNSAMDAVTYITPTGDKPSPVYSKVAVLKDHNIIYVGEMVGEAEVKPEEEVKTLFDQLKLAVEAAGSDYQHLVKATYYVSDVDVSKELNNIRPKIYDPKSPPTASKVSLKNIGSPERGMLIDMIAVPAPNP